jgi:hypothetical protein
VGALEVESGLSNALDVFLGLATEVVWDNIKNFGFEAQMEHRGIMDN